MNGQALQDFGRRPSRLAALAPQGDGDRQRHAAQNAASTGNIEASGDFKKVILASLGGFIVLAFCSTEGVI